MFQIKCKSKYEWKYIFAFNSLFYLKPIKQQNYIFFVWASTPLLITLHNQKTDNVGFQKYLCA